MYDGLRGVLLICALFVVASGYTQGKKYPYVQDGKIIVCREGNDGVKLSLIHPNWTSTSIPEHNELSNEYNRFAAKFEVANSDAKGKDGSSTKMTWYEASGTYDFTCNYLKYSACANYSQDSGGKDKGSWRLPTIRELKLIYALQYELTVGSFSSYWSATAPSHHTKTIWYVSFDNGKEDCNWDKAYGGLHVRCVRDL